MSIWKFVLGMFIITYLFCFQTFGQQEITISGILTDDTGLPIPDATIQLKNKPIGTHTAIDGSYRLTLKQSSSFILVFSMETYRSVEKTISFSHDSTFVINVVLMPTLTLGEVEIVRKTESTQKVEEGFQLDVIELKEFQNLSGDLNKVLKSTQGINIRESGGLGSGFELSLNGLSGNQIKYFIDGVPMENFGSSLTLNNYPVNLIKRVEVYKGAVPISLSSDALGGAVNIITTDLPISYLDASYSGGSFNTHRVSANGQYVINKKVKLRFLSFFNHSDNSYDMDSVSVYDLALGNFLEKKTVKRWHDQYTSGMARAELIVRDLKWADQFSLQGTFASNRKNYQHPDNNLKRIFNDFHTRNKTFLISTNYEKKFSDFELSLYAVGGWIQDRVIDTSRLKYNWNQEFIEREEDNPKGELYGRRSLFIMQDLIQRSSLGLRYNLSKKHQIEARLYQGYLSRIGEDAVNEFNQSFTSPNRIEKYILGLAYTFKTENEKIQGSLFGKEYWYRGKITSTDLENNVVSTRPSLRQTGFGAVGSIYLFKPLLLRVSAEQAYRIPESHEILGDGIYIQPNPDLKPENSINFNTGFLLNLKTATNYSINASINGFYRYSKDFIRFNPTGPFGTFENLKNITSLGIEGGANFTWKKRIRFGSSLTFQHITDQTKLDEGLPNTNYLSRIPNVPWLFGNFHAGYFTSFKSEKQRLGISSTLRYVHSFFLTWENLGSSFSKSTIPAQLTQAIHIEYSWKHLQYNTSLSVENLWNATVYDNFNIPKPGRAVYIKIRYNLKQKSNSNNNEQATK